MSGEKENRKEREWALEEEEEEQQQQEYNKDSKRCTVYNMSKYVLIGILAVFATVVIMCVIVSGFFFLVNIIDNKIDEGQIKFAEKHCLKDGDRLNVTNTLIGVSEIYIVVYRKTTGEDPSYLAIYLRKSDETEVFHPERIKIQNLENENISWNKI